MRREILGGEPAMDSPLYKDGGLTTDSPQIGSRFTSPAADVRDMPEILLSGHEPGVRVSQQEETSMA